jgi:hypothetical protein
VGASLDEAQSRAPQAVAEELGERRGSKRRSKAVFYGLSIEEIGWPAHTRRSLSMSSLGKRLGTSHGHPSIVRRLEQERHHAKVATDHALLVVR